MKEKELFKKMEEYLRGCGNNFSTVKNFGNIECLWDSLDKEPYFELDIWNKVNVFLTPKELIKLLELVDLFKKEAKI